MDEKEPIKKRKKLKDLPPIFSKISDRFASDYLIAFKLYFMTRIEIDVARFPISLLPKPKEDKGWDQSLFSNILGKVIDNDEELSFLLKESKIQNLKIRK